MPAYLFIERTITDPQGFDDYVGQVGPTILQFGGKLLSQSRHYEVLEQQRPWQPDSVLLIEFVNIASLRAWHDSREYEPFRRAGRGTTQISMIALEGA